ncbi:Aste57867_906 [Aphanomyces stellatus]|uniref:Aste57867_906 protein n=1 Tax=Aphanomyces stellatus TaxID=120398 RepID=A0A485K8W5_9STRA|nr:hypothetical protein As57867_000905 [Aphanomyces stellatus]VFT78130.1 Aste57867_906 [Aphanomyces stellatus]
MCYVDTVGDHIKREHRHRNHGCTVDALVQSQSHNSEAWILHTTTTHAIPIYRLQDTPTLFCAVAHVQGSIYEAIALFEIPCSSNWLALRRTQTATPLGSHVKLSTSLVAPPRDDDYFQDYYLDPFELHDGRLGFVSFAPSSRHRDLTYPCCRIRVARCPTVPHRVLGRKPHRPSSTFPFPLVRLTLNNVSLRRCFDHLAMLHASFCAFRLECGEVLPSVLVAPKVARPACHLCQKRFGLWRPKANYRKCGEVFCTRCCRPWRLGGGTTIDACVSCAYTRVDALPRRTSPDRTFAPVHSCFMSPVSSVRCVAPPAPMEPHPTPPTLSSTT